MRRKQRWIVAVLIVLGLLKAGIQAAPAAGAGNISFGPGNDVGASADTVGSVALGDLDNDGDLDIVSGTVPGEGKELIVWENEGTPFSGLWTPNDAGDLSYSVQSVAMGDLDNDGDLDIVSGDSGGWLTVWENEGSPFTGAWTPNQVGQQFWGAPVALGDLDNDGFLDIASGDVAGDVVVWQNDSTPFSDPWTPNDVGTSAADIWAVAVGDLNNDGKLDIVTGTTTEEDYELIIWQNDATPFTGTWTQNDVGPSAGRVNSVAVGDLDNDGNLDIVSSSNWEADDEVTVWENDGSPFSGLWTENGTGWIADTAFSVAVGDLDNDGDLDIVSGLESGAGTEVAGLENDGTPFDGDWGFAEVGHSDGDVKTVAVGDLDNDGDVDVVTGSDSREDYEIIACPNTLPLRNLPFSFPGNAIGSSTAHVYGVVAGDLDRDGDLDVVSASTSNEDYEVIAWQNGGAPFEGLWAQNDVGASDASLYYVAVGDLDNDGDLDVVSAGSQGASYQIMAWRNDRPSTFSGTWTSNNVGTSLRSVWEVRLGDLDKDGDLDIVGAIDSGTGYEIFVWQNEGTPFTGTWTSNGVGDSTADVNSVALGDLDNDGDLDIVSGSESEEDYEVIAWQNDGTPFGGTWTQNDVGLTLASLSSVALGDLDNDGDLDIVSGGSVQEDYEVIAWQNNGTPFGGLWSQNDVGASDAGISSVELGDLDNDGDLDIVSGNSAGSASKVVVWQSDGTPFSGLWTAHHMGTADDHLYSVALGDLDNDGDLDVLTGSAYGADYEVLAWHNRDNLESYIPLTFSNYP
jgi:hypothetical protein